MKSWLVAIMLCSALVVPGPLLHAQGVYVTQGEHGPVFSDKPQSGAKEVTLRPLTVLDAPKESKLPAGKSNNTSAQPKGDNQRSGTARTSYQSLAILSPENESSVIINTGAINVRVAADPSLQLGEGHAFAVAVNGRDVGQRFTSTEFTIPPEFWGGNPPVNEFAQLDVGIVDGYGRVLIRAASVRFFMRFTTVLNNPNRFHPFPIITPIAPIVPIVQPSPTTGKASSNRSASGTISK